METLISPPGPKGHLFVGNLPELRRIPLEFMTECARTYGDMVYLNIANVDVYLLNHPDLVEHVLVTANRNFIKPRLLRDAGSVLGNGLLTSEGDLWLRQRRLMQPAFHRERIMSYGATMVDYTERMLDGWRDGATLDVHEEMMHLTFGIVSRTLFGTDVDERAKDVGAALDIALKRFVDRMSLLRVLDRLPLPRNLRFNRALAKLDEIIYGVIEQRRANREESDDLLSLLLEAHDEEGAMSDRQLRDEAITLFLAGHETTALSLTWTLYLLALNPEAEQRLVAELLEVPGDRPPTADDLPRLRYTDMVLKESMRLYPPAWRVGREAVEPCEVGGYEVPSGAQLIMSQWVIHRDPRFFDNPEIFLPERWEGDMAKRIPKFAYFPFGGGARRCVGDAFAMMEGVLLLASIVRRFRLELVPGQRIEFWPSITLRPRHGVAMRVVRR